MDGEIYVLFKGRRAAISQLSQDALYSVRHVSSVFPVSPWVKGSELERELRNLDGLNREQHLSDFRPPLRIYTLGDAILEEVNLQSYDERKVA